MRIVQISDFHFTHLTMNPLRLLSKRFLGYLNWIFLRRRKFFFDSLASLPKLFTDLNVDLVLFGGDFSTTALLEEFEKASRFVRKVKQPWLATAGNHDHYTYRSCSQKHFYRYFANKRKKIAHPVEFFTLKDHGIEAHSIKAGYWLIVLDTAIATNLYSSEGLFSEKLQKYLTEVLNLISQTDSIVLLNHYPLLQNDVERHSLRRSQHLRKLIEQDPRIKMYLHGHTHRHTIADLQPNNLPLILDSGSCTQNGSWNLIDLKSDGAAVSTYQWQNSWTKTSTREFQWKRQKNQ
jgi:3',5'-cyclic AMP phosphodiesterase CpdA